MAVLSLLLGAVAVTDPIVLTESGVIVVMSVFFVWWFSPARRRERRRRDARARVAVRRAFRDEQDGDR